MFQTDSYNIIRLLGKFTLSHVEVIEIALRANLLNLPTCDGWNEQGDPWWTNLTVAEWLQKEIEAGNVH